LSRRALLSILVLMLAVAGCRDTGVDESTPEGMARLAGRSLEEGDYAAALEGYEEALRLDTHPDGRPSWELGRARALLGLSRWDRAAVAAGRALELARDPAVKGAARLVMAQARHGAGEMESAADQLALLDPEDLNGEQVEVAVSLARAVLEDLRTEKVSALRDAGWLELFVLLELEDRYYASGDAERAALVSSEIDRLYPEAHRIYGRPETRGVEKPYMALLVPLSGPEVSVYAREVKRAAELAFSRAEGTMPGLPELVVVDSGSETGSLERLLAPLGEDRRCLAVIGPLTSSATMRVAPLAREYRLPVLSPTATSSEIDRLGSYVHRLSVGGGREAAAMAEYAVVKGGMQRLAVIHSFEARSTDLAESFASSVRSLGGAVVAMQGYQRGATDFKDQILAVKAARPDGIYIPVDAWDAVQIAPQLRFYSLDLPLLGSSGWDDQMLTRLGGEYVDGAVFPVSCDAGSLYPPAARFNYFYRRQYGEEPSEVAAQAYDAAQILLSAWQRAGDDRAGMERALASMGVHVGATGRCTLGAAGDASRVQVPLMTVSEGEVLRLE